MQAPEVALLQLLKALNQQMLTRLRAVAFDHDLPGSGIGVLHQVRETPGATVSEISRQTHVAKSHISTTVDELCRQGFLDKRPDAQDHRLVRLYQSEKAQQISEAVLSEAKRELRAVLDSVPSETLASLIAGLEALLVAFEQDAADRLGGSHAQIGPTGSESR